MIRFYGNPWASSNIRGKQIVDALVKDGVDAVFNSEEPASKGDKLVFVKCAPNEDSYEVTKACDVFIDIVDSHGTIDGIKRSEHLKNANIIAIGDLAYNYLSNELRSHKIIKIPEHHCNFENAVRDSSKKVDTVGFCGYPYNLHIDVGLLERMLGAVGYRVLLLTDMQNVTREAICDFYKQIDIQICYRRDVGACVPQLKNPLKVINAASFGVPTVTYLEPSYVECKDIIVLADDIYGMAKGIISFTDDSKYNEMSEKCIEFARDYHIDKIVSKYKEILC